MGNTLLITATETVSLSFVDGANFKTSKIKDAVIFAAQEQWIRPILGDTFYYELQTQVRNNSLNNANLTLLNTHIKQTLAFYVKYVVLPDLSYNLSNKGIKESFGQYSKAVSSEEKSIKRQAALTTADSLAGAFKKVYRI